MKKIWIVIVIIVVVLLGAYLGRHQIKTLFGGSSVSPTNAPVVAVATPTIATILSDNIYKTSTAPKSGVYMTDFNGMALYTYDKDSAGVSNCTGVCATNWPYYTSGATAQKTFPENISVIKRSDGNQQFAWKGMPLYYFVKDIKPGDILGDGVGGVWHLVKISNTPSS